MEHDFTSEQIQSHALIGFALLLTVAWLVEFIRERGKLIDE